MPGGSGKGSVSRHPHARTFSTGHPSVSSRRLLSVILVDSKSSKTHCPILTFLVIFFFRRCKTPRFSYCPFQNRHSIRVILLQG